MHNEGNIFDGIVTNERTYTELFRNMCRYKFFRDEFARFLKQHSERNEEWQAVPFSDFSFQFSQVETQYYAEDSSTYPDVVIDTGNLRLMIEIKTNTWTSLQDSQPRDYLANLEGEDVETDSKGLFFLVPRHYSHETMITDRVASKETQKRMRNAGIKPVVVLHWEDFIEHLVQAGAEELDPILQDYIDLSNNWFINGKIALHSGELSAIKNDSLGSGLYALRAVVEIVRDRFRRTEKLKMGRIHTWDYDFGFYLVRDGNTVGYFGIDSYAWVCGFSPLVLGVKPNEIEDVRLTKDLIWQSEEDGLHYWGLSASLLSTETMNEEISNRFGSIFNLEPNGKGEAEDEAEFSSNALTALFENPSSAAAYQKLLRVTEQVQMAVKGSDQQIKVKQASSRYEHTLYFYKENKNIAAFGIFFVNWADEGGLPLWIGLPKTSSAATFERLESQELIGNGGYPENDWMYRQLTLHGVSPEEDLVEYSLKVLKNVGLSTGLPD